MTEKPHFLARKIQDFQRASAKGFVCPFCTTVENFQQEARLWEHAKNSHPNELGISEKGDEVEVRKQLRLNATERAHKTFRRVTREPEPTNSKPSSNDNDSMKPNVGEDAISTTPSRPFSAPGLIRDPEKRIDDIGNLSLGQAQPIHTSGTQPGSSAFNPLKRGALGESDQTEASPDQTSGTRSSSNRRAKALSGGPFIVKDKQDQDPEFNRGVSRPSEPSTSRNPLGPIKRLFDPNTDNPSSSPANRRSKQEPAIPARRFYDPRAHVFRSRKAPSAEREDFQPNTNYNSEIFKEQQIKNIEKSSSKPIKLEGKQSAIQDEIINATTQVMDADWDLDPEILLQPETRPISHDQLVVEVKGIYAGLVMVEAKCIDVDEKQSSENARQNKLSNEQWQALIALHKTLLHEHHDFFLASQHPSASPALSRLAAKYSMPARMWRHGIHAFLEVLRHRLPESLDHMLAFIYIAYSMMALLYETVSTFEDTWIECLGDLGRYRMAIEDDDVRDREVWSGVARFWYSKAADKSPNVGRLYHHLAILARPFTLQQLAFYTRSLTCVTPFENARGSIMTLFTPILNGKESAYHRSSSLETLFIKAHGMLFSAKPFEEFDAIVRQMMEGLLDNYIGRVTAKFKEQGVFAAVANIAALFEYGSLRGSGAPKSIFRLAFEQAKMLQIQRSKTTTQRINEASFDVNDNARRPFANTNQLGLETLTSSEFQSSRKVISHASKLAFGTLSISLQRIGDKNVLPLIHVYFVFLWSLAAVEKAMIYVEKDVPWGGICSFLNHTLAKLDNLNSRAMTRLMAEQFPKFDNGIGRPLPEEFAIRGQMYTREYDLESLFKDAKIDDEERSLELPSMAAPRTERILWLGFRIASFNRWIKYDEGSKMFEVTQYFTELLETSLDKTEYSSDLAPGSEYHDSLMSDVGAVDPGTDDEIISSPATPERLISSKSPTSTTSNKSVKIERTDDTKADIMMVDADVMKTPYNNPKTKPNDPAKETATETWLKSGFGQKTPPQKSHEDYFRSDTRKVYNMDIYDSPDNKKPSKV